MASGTRAGAARRRDFSPPWFWAAFALVVAVSAVLRFWELDDAPIWMDEAFTIIISRLPASSLLFERVDVHPPLVYLVQKLWRMVSEDLSLARVPAATFGVCAVAALTLSVSDLVSRRAGLLSGLFLALSPGHVYFSQDARQYPMLTFLLAMAAWGLVGGLGRPDETGPREPWLKHRAAYGALYVLGAVAAIYSHAVGLVFLAVLNFAVLLVRYALPSSTAARPYFRHWLVINLAVFVLSLPWLVQIPGARDDFGGVGSDPITVAPWFLRNAIGFAGLPSLVRKLAELALVLLAFAGGVAAWRQDRRMAATALLLLVLYPLAIALLNFRTPILANRIFLPAALPLAVLVGCALAEALRRPALGLTAAAVVFAVTAASTALEHAARAKYEDLPAALGYAAAQGHAGEPIFTCSFFTAGSIWAARPGAPFYIVRSDGVLRFDPRFMTAARMGIGRLHAASAAEIDRFLGGGYLVGGGLPATLQGRNGAVVIAQPCAAGYAGEMRKALAGLGLQPAGERVFRDDRRGEVVMQQGQTKVELYRRRG